MGSIMKEYADLIRKYQIPLTSFYWRKKKAGDDDQKLIEYLEQYKKMSEERARRKQAKEEAMKKGVDNSPFPESKYVIDDPGHLMSHDEYYLYIYEHIKKSVYIIKPKYPSAIYNKLENEDIIHTIFIQCIRPTRDRVRRTKIIERYSYKYKVGDVLETTEDGNVEVVQLDEKGKIDQVRFTNKPVTDTGDPDVIDGIIQEIEWVPRRVDLVDKHGEYVYIESTTLYDKYLKDPSSVSTIRSFANFTVHNYFRDYISKERNTNPPISIYKPIADDESMVLADIFSIEDEDRTSIIELIDRCDEVNIKDMPLSTLIKMVIDGYSMTQACRELGITVSKARKELDKIGAKQILGGSE